MTKTLVVHPIDRSTDFLDGVYKNKADALVVRSNVGRDGLARIIERVEPKEIYLLGHGLPQGLIGFDRMVVDETFVPFLRGRDLVGIWCNADVFFTRHELSGLYTGMFVSEPREARVFNLDPALGPIEKGNAKFATAVEAVLRERDLGMMPESEVQRQIRIRYQIWYGLAQKRLPLNSVLGFNAERIYYTPRKDLLPPSQLERDLIQEEIDRLGSELEYQHELFSWEVQKHVS
jgi:hypothetical protein